MPDDSLFHAAEHLREELYSIRQQLRLYAQLTMHETRSPLTIDPDAFSYAMSHLAEQVEAAIEYTEALALKLSKQEKEIGPFRKRDGPAQA